MRNRYKKVAYFSEAKFRQILKCFSHDLTATHNPIDWCIAQQGQQFIHSNAPAYFEPCQSRGWRQNCPGTFECDESYFGGNGSEANADAVLRENTWVWAIEKRGQNLSPDRLTFLQVSAITRYSGDGP